MILDTIIEHKIKEVASAKARVPLAEVKAAAADAPKVRGFAEALIQKANRPAVIAEVKKASPSKGVIRADFDPVSIAKSYEIGGASAISVLTDEKFFQGKLDYLTMVREAVSLPVLRKDFVIDEYQVYEARAAGADAVLLIVAALEDEELKRLHDYVTSLGMDALVEVHDECELERAMAIDPKIVGINNRNLRTFEVSLDVTRRLVEGLGPRSFKLVSESGIHTREDMIALGGMGIDAALIGESLMREPDPGVKLRELLS